MGFCFTHSVCVFFHQIVFLLNEIYGKCAWNYLEQKIQQRKKAAQKYNQNCLRYKFIVTIDFVFGLILD